jgi:hypothetical protein
MSRLSSKVVVGLILAFTVAPAGGCMGTVTITCPSPATCISS